MEKEDWLNPFDRIRTSWAFILVLLVALIVITYQIMIVITEPNSIRPLQPYVLKNDQIKISDNLDNITNITSGEDEKIVPEVLDPAPLKSKVSLPDDLNEKPCGYYYRDYGSCSGTCPEGICVTEGRNCYCKKE